MGENPTVQRHQVDTELRQSLEGPAPTIHQETGLTLLE